MLQINNISAKIARHKTQLVAATERVLASGWMILGPEVKQFETSFANYLNAGFCVSVANGTDAIELGLRALGVGSGNRVATVANAGMYTTTALLAVGAEPFFIDVDLETRNTTLAEVERALNAGVNAVVVTHLYGSATPEIEAIARLCSQKDIPVLEDCAQAHGAKLNGKCVGTFGDASSYSFYPTKNLGALGDGGAVVTNRAEIAERITRLRQYGWGAKYQVEMVGGRNSRLDEMQAAILSVFLPHLDAANARRREIARRYSEQIKHPDVLVPAPGGPETIAHLYVIRSSERDKFREHLKTMEVASDVHYPLPDYSQPVLGERFSNNHLENTETLAEEILTLPCYPEMSDLEVEKVIAAVNSWLV